MLFNHTITAAVTLGGVNMADAQIICDSAASVTANAQGESFDFDVDGDGVDDFNISVAGTFNGAGFPSVSSFFVISGLGSNLVGADSGTATYNGVNNYLGVGAASTSAGVMFIRYPGAGGLFYGAGGPFGLQFDIGGVSHVGFADLTSINSDNSATFNFQWEKVPEPSSLGLLAMGGLGLLARRKKS